MKKQVILFMFAITTGLFLSCEGKFEPINNLEAANLLLPEDNTQCLGERLPSNQIRVAFDWEDVDGIDSFLFEYEDTVTGEQFSETVTESSLELVLEPGTQYTWTVTVSDNFGNSKESDSFNFYTEGLATPNHVPFPADLEIADNGDGTADLLWESFDLDDDIDFYQVFFSTDDPPSELFAETTEISSTQPVISGQTYILRVKTVDRNGNFSEASLSKEF